jgi:putrescine transport system ATP-binding protein
MTTEGAKAPLVRFEGVAKRFGDTAAVDGVTLDIAEGEFFALLGPSGCGKTTLMRMLAGFEAPDQGRILLAGDDVAALPPHRRPVHMMFQSYALFPHLSVAKNIAFGLRQQRLAKPEVEARVEEMLALVRLEGLGDRKPDQLSGGQRQRVALARAIAPKPRILLLDEPMAALDRKLREETQLELMALQRRLGMTFMIVTHDQDEAMVVADRMAVMRDGRVEQIGAPREVYDHPASRYVAQFIGEANLFPEGPGWRAVRPEAMTLSPRQAAGARAGAVAEIAYFGDRTRYVVQVEGQKLLVSCGNVRPPLRLAVGDAVWVGHAPDAGQLVTT